MKRMVSEIKPGLAFNAVRWTREGMAWVMHRQDLPEMFWITAGMGTHTVNGRRVDLEEGDLVLMRPGDAHTMVTPKGRPLSWVNVAFDPGTLAHFRRRYFMKEKGLFWKSGELPATFRLQPAQRDWLEREHLLLDCGPWGRLQLERFLLNLLNVLSPSGNERAPGAVPAWFRKACREILVHPRFVLGAREFARLAGRSHEHVARETRRLLGCTPTDLVNRARIRHAATLLATTDEEILDIAYQCGFDSLSYFYKLFKAQFGHAPHQYRALGMTQLHGR